MSRSRRPAQEDRDGLDALMARMAIGDRGAFPAVYDRLAPPLYRLARSRGLPEETCETFVECALMAIWRSSPRLAQERRTALERVLAGVDDAFGALRAGGEHPAP